MDAAEIEPVLRETKVLPVLSATVVLEHGTNWVLDPCRHNARGRFLTRVLPPMDAWREQIKGYTPHSWRHFKPMH